MSLSSHTLSHSAKKSTIFIHSNFLQYCQNDINVSLPISSSYQYCLPANIVNLPILSQFRHNSSTIDQQSVSNPVTQRIFPNSADLIIVYFSAIRIFYFILIYSIRLPSQPPYVELHLILQF